MGFEVRQPWIEIIEILNIPFISYGILDKLLDFA